MKVIVGLDGLKLTNVPEEEILNPNKNYYVYEWFIKETERVFYVGKGKGSRYKQDKNDLFVKIKNNFDCDVRFVKEGLSEYEALVLEEEWMQKRSNEGHILANVVVVGGKGVYELDKYEYMKTPDIWVNNVDKYYFSIGNYKFNQINKENLLSTHIKEYSAGGLFDLYLKSNERHTQDKLDLTVKGLVDEVKQYIQSNEGRLYKTLAKKAKSIIYHGHLSYEDYLKHKNNGLDVYHLIDVLDYIKNDFK
jgi:hypothetical protein